MKIDAHHHFWHYTPQEYGWISEDMSAIRRDFLPSHLAEEIAAAGIDGVVSVQARQTVEETTWLLQLARENDFIRGVVGWVPLVAPGVRHDLERFVANAKFKGVRHVLHDEADEHYMLRNDFNAGIASLKEFGLTYDILIFERHLPQTIKFVDRHPSQIFVLDHIAKPRIKNAVIEPWRTHIQDLARRDNVYCKLSGMVTEGDHEAWTPDQLRPYYETVLEAFGPARLMFGTDWPVCLLACDYALWVETVHGWAALLAATERDLLFGGTAVKAYSL
jgi:L-fuconolactonase